MKTAILYWL
ncbi:hypothetical protein PRDcarrot_22 [Enterobacteria phage PRDcarrot]